MPDVSVVVIVYNDADRLPTAVQSVLDQTLRDVEVVIVDDCSTDRSFEVAQQLAAGHPGRVRAFQLPENSGAGGEPRNVGIQHTQGRYVMFLDSDDVLELNACRNMLEAAEETGSDIVSGLTVRLHKDTRNQKRDEWYAWLYSTTRTLESVTELPDLFVWDTLCTNKCYRREFLVENNLLFPKGMFYEDLVFIAEAYLAAQRITLIPNQVYFWHVHEQAAVKSVTNRRHEMSNYSHRLEIHRRIDAMLAERGLAEMKLAKDVKFLKHDLVLHLRDLPFRDESYRQEFAELSREYLASIAPEAYERVQPIQAICAYLLQQGDWDHLIPAVDTLINRDKVSSPLAEHDGRIYWCDGYTDDPFGRDVLDVTDIGYHEKPVNQLFLRNQLTRFAESGRSVSLTGRINNPLGIIPPGAQLKGELEFSARRRSLQTFHFPVRVLRHEGDAIHWETVADLTAKLRPLGIVDTIWDVRLRLDVDGVRTTSRLTVADTGLSGGLPVRPRLSRMVADRLEPHVSAKGHLAFRLVSENRNAERVQELITRGVRGRPGTLAKTGYRKAKELRKKVTSGDNKLRAYHEVFSRLPVKKRTVVFESHLGKQFSDSPRAIYEEMRRQGLEFEAIWSYAGSPKDFPKGVTLVKRWSLPYLKALAQAEFWVDNQSYPLKLTKRPETTYIQTWHGSALKNMGFDQPSLKAQTRQQQAEQQRSLDRFDRFLIRSEHDVHTLAKAFRLKEKTLLRVGYPRNDALVRARQREAALGARERGPLAAELGIAEDKTVLLYAPTFRKAGGRHGRFELPFDVERFADQFGDRYVLLVRSHYLNHVVLPPTVQGRVIDVSARHDVTPLLELADGLITDYSSVMFDYALLDRPLVFFTYDYDEYVHEGRGTYFDLLEHAPGPVVRTEDAFHEAIKSFESQALEYAKSRKEFVAKFGEYDQGNAAQSIVDQFFAQWSR
ncbi:bifunctional glycosyltransferase/CDP-glycerol:glycerophosphate glycerophosphotransferase [Streptomyces decoyicus]|uniref:bifunctional glycosyltransferase/CDP-glycerol:glycerophosphate glycerophosphotransferase n=1 Tax=Streptomyces decoyicus TaxID=249567 RepID=UPI00069E1C61|nr:bifunctional glycosyltransferase family 2 protein/CDP-glycerol:glycerophosphate glycerophosphotransferase [Streptomyces decoyicus]KOG39710.1 CDP-glycerol:glycerophosphate glycerophosphotransferase [Streptomyces decoyicus]QZY20552.1 bifunctional glycosyltransferase family 2 protein/CDP-glycerol:glycerophosphate glycerophosphotransferase [Streptomyces decoyicus]